MQLGGEADEWLPERFGDCRIEWGRVDPRMDWQIQREVLAILAGPVAEMIYRNESIHPARYAPWQHDWHHAWSISQRLVSDQRQHIKLLEELLGQLRSVVQSVPCWSAIAALADELAAHEYLESHHIEETIGFWFRNGS